jgi:Tfp pilus assembly protein PilZ
MGDSTARPLEHRRFARSPIGLPVEFTTEDSRETFSGTGRNISLGGIFIETNGPVSFGIEILVRIALPGHREPLVVPATVRWKCADGMGVQFGLLGAWVTYAIIKIVRANSASPRSP